MISEAHAIREDLVYRQQMSNNSQAGRQPGQHDETDDDDVNSRTIKEFPADTGTLVPDRGNGDGTMIAHEDYGTLVPDSGTMVELESNLGTMVINSDSEDSTMKSKQSILTILLMFLSSLFCIKTYNYHDVFAFPIRTQHQSW